MAAHSKQARRRGAYLVVLDESGFLMAPLVRRTLAPRGCTPILIQPGGHHHKVSTIAALSLAPRRQRLGLYFHTHLNTAINNHGVADFLRHLLRHLPGPVIVLWDRAKIHQGPGIREVQADYPRLQFESFPTYAPELNPVEFLWNHLKWHRLCNSVADNILHLDDILCEELYDIYYDPYRLRSFYDSSQLPFPTRALAS
jgi:transposase